MTQSNDTPDDAETFDRDAAFQQMQQTEAALREIVRRKRMAEQARARAAQASNKREFAVNCLLAMEDALFTMFDNGETPAEVLAYLERSMPGVPASDLRHALKILRARRQRSGLNALSRAPAPLNPGASGATTAVGKAAPAAGKTEPAVNNRAAPPRTAPGSALTGRAAIPAQTTAAKRPASASPASGAAQSAATNSASPAGAAIAALGLTLPPWADGSDKLPTESDEDYVFRKNLEMPPDHRRKFIGEHNS